METQKPGPVPTPSPAPKSMAVSAGIPLAALMQQQMMPALYANGFEVTVSGADVCIKLSQNNRPICTLNLSFTTAKGLGAGLSAVIKEFEERTQNKVPSFEEVTKAMEAQ